MAIPEAFIIRTEVVPWARIGISVFGRRVSWRLLEIWTKNTKYRGVEAVGCFGFNIGFDREGNLPNISHVRQAVLTLLMCFINKFLQNRVTGNGAAAWALLLNLVGSEDWICENDRLGSAFSCLMVDISTKKKKKQKNRKKNKRKRSVVRL